MTGDVGLGELLAGFAGHVSSKLVGKYHASVVADLHSDAYQRSPCVEMAGGYVETIGGGHCDALLMIPL